MTQPSDAWLRMAMPGLSADWTQPPAPAPDPFAAGAAAAGYTPVAAPAPGAVPPPPPPPAPAPPPPPLAPPTGAPPGPPPAPSTVKLSPTGEQQMQAMAASSANDTAQVTPAVMREAPADPADQSLPPDFKARLVSGGGTIPAHEAKTRGPLQEALLMGSFEPPAEAARSINFRNQLQAEREELMYEEQAAAAMKRQEAAQRVAVKRAQELEAMRQDYEASIQRLGQMHLDDNRWWANKSTGDKVGTLVMTFLGGLGSLGNGGRNLVYERIVDEIHQDVEAQKFDYEVGRQQALGKQTAYAMAMQQYGSEDVARAAATAAALDYAGAKAATLKAQWKGTESANAADELQGKLGALRLETASQGLKFVSAQQAAAQYQVSIGGATLPALVSGKEANRLGEEYAAKPAVDIRKMDLQGQINERGAAAKAAAEAKTKGREHAVVMPSGETVHAPSEKEADNLRDLTTSATEVQRLVREAKEIRDNASFRVSPEGRNKLGQIQKDLVTHFAVQNKLGALSNQDMDLAVGGTADLFQFGNGVEARLDRLNQTAIHKVATRVKTYPGGAESAPKTTGKMPGSFTAHGGK